MSRRIVRRTILWLILGLVILSCGTPALVTSPPSVSEPGALETVIIQTAAAAQMQTLESLPPFCSVNSDFKVVAVNTAFCNAIGMPRSKVLSKKCSDVLSLPQCNSGDCLGTRALAADGRPPVAVC